MKRGGYGFSLMCGELKANRKVRTKEGCEIPGIRFKKKLCNARRV
jgi:hypothetical protein